MVVRHEESKGHAKVCENCGVLFQSPPGFLYHWRNQVCIRKQEKQRQVQRPVRATSCAAAAATTAAVSVKNEEKEDGDEEMNEDDEEESASARLDRGKHVTITTLWLRGRDGAEQAGLAPREAVRQVKDKGEARGPAALVGLR